MPAVLDRLGRGYVELRIDGVLGRAAAGYEPQLAQPPQPVLQPPEVHDLAVLHPHEEDLFHVHALSRGSFAQELPSSVR